MVVSKPGVIVQIKIKHSNVPNDATGAFSILSGDGPPNFDARTSPLLPSVVWQDGQGAAVRTFKPLPDANGRARGVPVAAGERLAYRTLVGNSPGITDITAPGAQYVYFLGSHVVDAQFYVPELPDRELMVQMLIEPDADADGYGDETQDPCPITVGVACAPPCQQATHVGTAGNDVMVGTAGNDVIDAGAGTDTVLGLGGDDTVCGGDGNDKLKGGAGNDLLIGGTGADVLKGGGGARDLCKGGQGFDRASKCERVRSL